MWDFIFTINKYCIVLSYFFMNEYINLVSVQQIKVADGDHKCEDNSNNNAVCVCVCGHLHSTT